jgi:glycosyltransferase involved in cell wall biosynthesis
MITAVVPSYKNPKCLDICIKSFSDTTFFKDTSEIICIIDGFHEMYTDLIKQYAENKNIKFIINPQNHGMPFSINAGVYASETDWILVINDDNVFPMHWDKIISEHTKPDTVLSPNQIESTDSIFNFVKYDFGNIDNFRYSDFLAIEPTLREDELTPDGEIFPFVIHKKLFMAAGGFDLVYPSPFICDWDFFLKLELLNINFLRMRNLNFYHFGSIATKKSAEAQAFNVSENIASQIFYHKWGFSPSIDRPSNSHKPKEISKIRGISYDV